jgi:CelD/BcsL family acetyltransferase involved in cellulose biosynthesis
MVTVTILQDFKDLEKLLPEWEELYPRCPAATPFQHPRWIMAWQRTFGRYSEPWTLVIRESGRLAGVLPMVRERAHGQFLPVRQIRLLANGQSPRPGFLLAESLTDGVPRVVRTLEEQASNWDVLRLDGLEEQEFRLLSDATSSSTELHILDSREWLHSYLPLEGDWKRYLDRRSVNFRRTLRKSDTLLARIGSMEFAMAGNGDEIGKALEWFFRIDSRSWKSDGGEAIMRNPLLESYYRDLVREFAEIGGCGIFTLTLDRKPVASVLCLRRDRVLYTLKSSFDEEYAKYSPGTVLFHHLIRYAYQEGYRGIDFVSRIEFSERWTEETRRFRDMTFTNRNLYSRFLRQAREQRKKIRGLFTTVPAPASPRDFS